MTGHIPAARQHLIDAISTLAGRRKPISDRWTSAHAFNHVLRRCGLSPAEVGNGHPVADRAKAAAQHAVQVPIDLLRSRRRAGALAS